MCACNGMTIGESTPATRLAYKLVATPMRARPVVDVFNPAHVCSLVRRAWLLLCRSRGKGTTEILTFCRWPLALGICKLANTTTKPLHSVCYKLFAACSSFLCSDISLAYTLMQRHLSFYRPRPQCQGGAVRAQKRSKFDQAS